MPGCNPMVVHRSFQFNCCEGCAVEDNNLFIRVLRFSTEKEEFTFEDLCKAVSPNETQIKQLKLLIHNKDLLFQIA